MNKIINRSLNMLLRCSNHISLMLQQFWLLGETVLASESALEFVGVGLPAHITGVHAAENVQPRCVVLFNASLREDLFLHRSAAQGDRWGMKSANNFLPKCAVDVNSEIADHIVWSISELVFLHWIKVALPRCRWWEAVFAISMRLRCVRPYSWSFMKTTSARSSYSRSFMLIAKESFQLTKLPTCLAP